MGSQTVDLKKSTRKGMLLQIRLMKKDEEKVKEFREWEPWVKK